MSFNRRRSRGFQRGGVGVQSSLQAGSRSLRGQRTYVSQQSGTKRHQFQSLVSVGTPLTLTAGLYFAFRLLRFQRSKAGGTNDVPPDATASNNYTTPNVFNGGKIVNFQATIKIKNRGNVGGYLDIYQVAVSFYDVLVWNTLFPSACPVTFDNTTVGPADLRGQVDLKAVTSILIVKNTINNFKFLQHYIQPMGSVFVTNEDGGNGGEVTINVNRVPAKCRRSQTGMFWALFFHNDSDVNGSETLVLDATITESFEEIPSDNRLPYID